MSDVVFLSSLPPDLQAMVESRSIKIVAWWDVHLVFNELLTYDEDDILRQWVGKNHMYPPEVYTFLDACLDWRDTLPAEEGHDALNVINAVADSYIDSEDPTFQNRDGAFRGEIRSKWLESFVVKHIPECDLG